MTPARNRLVPGVVGVILVAGAIIAWRRRRRSITVEPLHAATQRGASALLATELFEGLENVMSSRGVHRTVGTPPLKHAESLVASGHALGDDYRELVVVYLEARFGSREVTPVLKKDFEERVREIKAKPLQQA